MECDEPLPPQPRFFDPHAETEKYAGANLPHWDQEGCCCFVTFRLTDSLPAVKVEAWREEKRRLERRLKLGAISQAEARRLQKQITREMQDWLDLGSGECLMLQPAIADLVETCLRYFDGERYHLWAWSVMPNHVHVVFQPNADYKLSAILGSWKSFSAHEINKVLDRRGACWQQESFDHLVRSQAAFEWAVEYTYNNASAAGLINWKWQGRKNVTWC